MPGSVNRFLGHFQPSLALILETELWPNMLFGCRDRGIPVYILNARLSARSLRGYRLLAALIRRALHRHLRAAQSQDDAERFVQLGADPGQVQALGNLKFDIATPDVQGFVEQFHARVPAARPVWIAASTHDGEEQAVIDLHRRLRQRHPELLLWAPRHPERFPKVEALAREQGWSVATRRVDQWPGGHRRVRHRHPWRADAVLCLRPGRLRRRQPAGHRWSTCWSRPRWERRR